MNKSAKLVRRVGAVSTATLLSRALGYARDALVASAFGGGYWTDAFYAAFRLPNLLRRILGEGPVTSAFVPAFARHLAGGRREEGTRFFQSLFSALLVLLALITLLGVIFAPELAHLVAWGFKDEPGKFALTVALTRLTFPFVLFVCLAAVAAGALNSLGYFFLPSLAPAMLSVAEIGFVLFLAKSSFWKTPLHGLAVSAVAGGVLHFAVLVPLLKRERLWPRWLWNPGHPSVRAVGLAIVPAVWGLSLDQVSAFIDTVCASFLAEGSVTALYNSNRLMQFPLALFGIAMSTAALPSLAAHAARREWGEMKETLNFALRVVIFTVLPAMAGLIVLGTPVVELLFEHGRFTHRATLLTSSALTAYCLGLPAYAAVKVLVNGFYSLQDIRTPVRVASYCLLVNMAGNLALMWRWGVGGLALATAIASSVQSLVLFWLLRRRLGLLGGRRLLKTLLQSAAAGAGMALAAGAVCYLLPGKLLWRVPLAVSAGVLVYLGIARALKMEEYHHLRHLLRREPGNP